MVGERISNIATLPHFGPKDNKYYERDMARRIGIASGIVNEKTMYVKCKLAFNCQRRDVRQACYNCIYNNGNSPVPREKRMNHHKAIIDTGRPLTIDGRIREKMNDPIFL